jgi:hypothetical protein
MNVADLYQFWLFFLLMVLSWISMAVVVSIGDAICFEMLGKFAESYECMYTVIRIEMVWVPGCEGAGAVKSLIHWHKQSVKLNISVSWSITHATCFRSVSCMAYSLTLKMDVNVFL